MHYNADEYVIKLSANKSKLNNCVIEFHKVIKTNYNWYNKYTYSHI